MNTPIPYLMLTRRQCESYVRNRTYWESALARQNIQLIVGDSPIRPFTGKIIAYIVGCIGVLTDRNNGVSMTTHYKQHTDYQQRRERIKY
jgi:hypothetical protein